jgi:hypothetical protein
MGKKEKEIKHEISEYNKKINYVRDYKKEQLVEDELMEIQNKKERNESNFDNMLLNIKRNIMEYVDHQGLPICQTLNDTNIENYAVHILRGCPKPFENSVVDERIETNDEKQIDVFDIETSKTNTLTMTSEINELQHDIEIIKKETITRMGEHDIFKEYIQHAYAGIPNKIDEEKKLFPLLRKRMIKMSGGIDKYNNWVNRIGLYEYKKAEHLIN